MSALDRIQLVQQRISQNYSLETRIQSMQFQPRSTDVFVVGAYKTGTTWMQQIMHQLRTGGDMDFEDITGEVPLIDAAYDTQQDLTCDQKASPRCFKSHYCYHRCPKGAKYIWTLREPCAVSYSYYNMLRGWFFQPGELTLEEFVEGIWLTQGEPQVPTDREGYFYHLASWWPHRNDPNILLVLFEELKWSYEPTIRKIAHFMGIEEEANIKAALENCTFECMKKNSDKFDDKLFKNRLNKNFGAGGGVGIGHSLVQTGTTTEGLKMLSAETQQKILDKWKADVTPVTGYSTYDELRTECMKK